MSHRRDVTTAALLGDVLEWLGRIPDGDSCLALGVDDFAAETVGTGVLFGASRFQTTSLGRRPLHSRFLAHVTFLRIRLWKIQNGVEVTHRIHARRRVISRR